MAFENSNGAVSRMDADHQEHRQAHLNGLSYLTGYGNTFESELLPGALPKGRNTPRLVPYNLYTEQLSGTAFTAPRVVNRRTWLYRIQPSVSCNCEQNWNEPADGSIYPKYFGGFGTKEIPLHTDPNPLRWKPLPLDDPETVHDDFVSGMKLVLHSGSALTKHGLAVYMYAFGKSMDKAYFSNADGDLMIVPQQSTLLIYTELGRLRVEPQEICVLPRGVVFSVHLVSPESSSPSTATTNNDNLARGYVLEVFKGHFELPELGPIGSNGLANARDFLHPTAWCVTDQDEYHTSSLLLHKFNQQLFSKESSHSPLNVVAWHGNYLPFKYDLRRFCAVNSVTYDHLDPSIYTVLTCVGHNEGPGVALADFVIFPPRVMATDSNTFRPPWFHRNTMTEFMGLICGAYDAKSSNGFQPGGASLHSCMTPHGPDQTSYDKAVADPCDQPKQLDGGMAFMFETSCIMQVTDFALNGEHRDVDYAVCWSGLNDQFTAWKLLGEMVSRLSSDEKVEK
jgi:homogentisate 1,2-dioxygenase